MVDPYYWFFPPLSGAVERISSLSPQQFDLLKAAVSGPLAFDRSTSRLRALQEEFEGALTPSDLLSLLGTLEYLYDQVRGSSSRDAERNSKAEVAEFLEMSGLADRLEDPSKTEELERRISLLVETNPDLERRRKLHRLRTGLLETAVEFSSFVDVRPFFDGARTRIEDSVPAVILRIGTETQSGEDRGYVVQLTEDGLAQLQAILEDIAKKLAIIKAQGVPKPTESSRS